MALSTTTATSATPLSNFSMKLLRGRSFQLHNHLLVPVRTRPIPFTLSIKIPTRAQYNDPSKMKMHIIYIREKLWSVMPNQIKEFPWRKAEAIALKQFLVTSKEALKWYLYAMLILGSIQDVVFSISRNKELLVPFGLIIGCTMANFLKEILQELFPNSEEEGLSWKLLGVCCFFVLVKIVATLFSLGGQVFLLHVANGGLMQILWPWRTSQEENNSEKEKNPL